MGLPAFYRNEPANERLVGGVDMVGSMGMGEGGGFSGVEQSVNAFGEHAAGPGAGAGVGDGLVDPATGAVQSAAFL